MVTRRDVLLAGSAGALLGPSLAGAAPIINEDGLFTESWFLESLLELSDDLKEATARNKRFVVIWSLKGCPACRKTHEINFADAAITSFIKEQFDVLQLNIIGAREVVDFDGEKLSEKALALKYGVRFTPTFQFFGEDAAALASRKPRERESTRGQGYIEPKPFLGLFRYVAEKAYDKGSLTDYLKAAGG